MVPLHFVQIRRLQKTSAEMTCRCCSMRLVIMWQMTERCVTESRQFHIWSMVGLATSQLTVESTIFFWERPMARCNETYSRRLHGSVFSVQLPCFNAPQNVEMVWGASVLRCSWLGLGPSDHIHVSMSSNSRKICSPKSQPMNKNSGLQLSRRKSWLAWQGLQLRFLWVYSLQSMATLFHAPQHVGSGQNP